MRKIIVEETPDYEVFRIVAKDWTAEIAFLDNICVECPNHMVYWARNRNKMFVFNELNSQNIKIYRR